MITVKNQPTLSVPPIVFQLQPNLKEQVQTMSSRYGYTPIAYYNNLPIEEGNIVYFKLESIEWLPRLTIVIKDWSSQLKAKLFALDNQNITIFINARENGLRDILMDFKIMTYDYDQKKDVVMITGWPNINELYIEKNKSYPNMTSYEVLEQIATTYKLGFATNINATNDRMTWINPGDIAEEFIIKTVHRAYTNDDAFMWSFLDVYYNLNFFDVEVEMDSDASKHGHIGLRNIQPIHVPIHRAGLSQIDRILRQIGQLEQRSRRPVHRFHDGDEPEHVGVQGEHSFKGFAAG